VAQHRFDYTVRPLTPSGFCARRLPLRARPRLKPSNFCLRPSVLIAPQELGFDGTLESLFALYKTHAASPWRRLSASSRQSYGAYSRGIAREHGHHRIAGLTGLDMVCWADSWAAPIGISGERLSADQCAKQVLRNALKFGAALGLPGCADLVQDLPLPRWHR
jgi:hypothetical protein